MIAPLILEVILPTPPPLVNVFTVPVAADARRLFDRFETTAQCCGIGELPPRACPMSE
jgi:hypothetical protein